MKFGRLASVEGVDFSLPKDASWSRALPGRRVAAPEIRCGLSSWADRGFLGRLYPAGTPTDRFLASYAASFPAIELNSTFYGFDPGRMATWASRVPAGFRFCPKLPSEISHERGLGDVERPMEAFTAALGAFGERLGPVFVTPATDFGPESWSRLEAFVRRYSNEVELAIELRHGAWFAEPRWLDAWSALFREHGVTAVLTDVAGRRDVLHMGLSTPKTFVRFVGNGLHPSDFTRLTEWSIRLTEWVDAGLESCFFFLHQQREVETLELAGHFLPELSRSTGIELPGPRPVPEQLGLF